MRKVRYSPARQFVYVNLTIGKVYDVINYKDGFVAILDDDERREFFPLFSEDIYGRLEFVDVTAEHRREVIENILM